MSKTINMWGEKHVGLLNVFKLKTLASWSNRVCYCVYPHPVYLKCIEVVNHYVVYLGFLYSSADKESTCDAGDPGQEDPLEMG